MTNTDTADDSRTDTPDDTDRDADHGHGTAPDDTSREGTVHARVDVARAGTFAGVYPAVVTPFDETGAVDHDRLRRRARRLERAGVDGIVPAGSTGEAATLSHDEHVAVVETVAEAVDVAVVGDANVGDRLRPPHASPWVRRRADSPARPPPPRPPLSECVYGRDTAGFR